MHALCQKYNTGRQQKITLEKRTEYDNQFKRKSKSLVAVRQLLTYIHLRML